ncbi:hypothetical protein [Halopiger djelfimassiliensis]|uniref:hypothetical protein n=1 Tax=Halopiger djelfimassiliensis TaxID=1293047 RepID=UPI001E45B5D5|nr:hypothetical protein [Halopiger djelfimassiliensis]
MLLLLGILLTLVFPPFGMVFIVVVGLYVGRRLDRIDDLERRLQSLEEDVEEIQ